MLAEVFTTVSSSRDAEGFLIAVTRFAHWLGFEKYAAFAAVEGPGSDGVFKCVDNVPQSYRDMFDDRDAARRDPVMQHCKRSGLPIAWDQATYVASGCGEKWETQSRFGYKTGVAVALHLPEGRHFFVGVDRDQALPKDRTEVSRMLADLQLFTALAQDTAFRVFWPEGEPTSQLPPLIRVELDALRWTLEGKTAWELAKILRISERAAVRHTASATRKLGCVNKHQAVMKAIRLELLR